MKYVLGHKNPDTDSIISAIAMADFLGDGYMPARSGDLNKESLFVLNEFGIESPELPELNEVEGFVLVDHNQEAQMFDGLDKSKIEMIVDHHNLGGLALLSPIFIRIEPTGCTATIIYKLYKEAAREIPENIKKLLLASILSDTLNFSSPTGTEADKMVANEIARETSIKIDEFAAKMFKAKSDLTGMPISRVVSADYKEFEMGKFNVGIGVFETVDPAPALERKGEIVEAVRELQQEAGVDYIFFAVVDIVVDMAYLIMPTDKEKEVATAIFKGDLEDDVLKIPGVVSRKKQMVPSLQKYLENV
ncbi:MAG: hypothetical protein UU65_C0002G0209 [candidate division CPR2 bacterium GW2011_GWC1_41_48]|uniref:inorganic diphosphatase n=1 Tax=candidate division CPR2 bacterium GW2011_GWC1_41_48 TaxID=1618344 RepID=A0A0G0YIP6_UNCC2|nr:MAG: hypothetical protein UT47_C0002G0095 [candidate division CPR2 bacterium GW2011_GWC2_39_35]KKR27972.1 MAG: hypothetical protein UT60_C0031G0023 [candidate division CPR2 bacterium GW2011_GWD2_39_7]KKS09431.1 MAG: hypothetical protein UU65_C0002G0209 [candidate division CPR2 bacterium GW2011_GWC1_41_48]OGB72080.1 MAG: manganese-dependent inorganic pyrophosphatase [candidate division CPR2 bacterium GWD2_39_7]